MTDRAVEPALSSLFPALARLDDLLAAAMARAATAYGPSAADPFRGLHISLDEIRRLLGREPSLPTLASPTAALLAAVGEEPGFAWLTRTYSLSSIDVATLLIALAPEIDLRYGRLYAYLQDDVTKRRPTADLALNLLCRTSQEKAAHRADFGPDGTIVKQRLVRVGGESEAPLLGRPLHLDEQITRLLLRDGSLDSRLHA